jgi:transcription elongation factor Elf1
LEEASLAKLSDELAGSFPCPHCGHEITANLAGFQGDPKITCSNCGTGIQIRSGGTIGETVEKLDALNRAWDKLTKK